MKFEKGVLYYSEKLLDTTKYLENIKPSKDIPISVEKGSTGLILQEPTEIDLTTLSNEPIPDSACAKEHRFIKRQIMINVWEYQGEG